MVNRKYWLNLIDKLWEKTSIIWLYGVRRAGKTFICKSIKDIDYYDCELPSVRRILEDSESFLENTNGKLIAIDEIHRLKNASEFLKIAADYFPKTKIIATGSSILTANKKFKDSLTGRKKDILLTPINYSDFFDFKIDKITTRLIKGGLPPYILNPNPTERDYYEWIENYWAKDIQELFGVGNRTAFLKFTELLIFRSGGIFEASSYAPECEVSRQTIFSYLNILDTTLIANTIRPFSSRRSNEIIRAPKVYFFDTGFIRYFKGISQLKEEDLGFLWEHFVLNELISILQHRKIYYWRDKRGHEVAFIIRNHNGKNIAIECKWKEEQFSANNFTIFSKYYPDFENLVITSDTKKEYYKKISNVKIKFINAMEIANYLNKK